MELLTQTSAIEVFFDKTNQVLGHRWLRHVGDKEFMETISAVKDHYVRLYPDNTSLGWLCNTGDLEIVDNDVMNWLNTEFMPSLIGSGARNLAFVVSDNIFVQVAVEHSVQKLDDETGSEIHFRYFNSEEEARQWLGQRSAAA